MVKARKTFEPKEPLKPKEPEPKKEFYDHIYIFEESKEDKRKETKEQLKLKKLIELKEKKLGLLQKEICVNQIEGRERFLNKDIKKVKQEIPQIEEKGKC